MTCYDQLKIQLKTNKKIYRHTQKNINIFPSKKDIMKVLQMMHPE